MRIEQPGQSIALPVAIANGGTGGTSAAAARTALAVAASGSNSDLTAITGLSTPLAASQGGTGTATPLQVFPSLLSSTASINLKTQTATALYTVPAGKTLVTCEIIVRITASSGFAVAATISVGKASSYNEVVAATALTGLSAVGSCVNLMDASALQIFNVMNAGDVVSINVGTGATATTLTATVDYIGYLY